MGSENKLSTPLLAYAALMTLLVLTALAAALPEGPWNTPMALAIAATKTAIIFSVFMHLRWQRGVVRLFAVAGFLWLSIAGILTLTDYLTRSWRF